MSKELRINRRYIELREEFRYELLTSTARCWVAEIDGPLDTGENVRMSREAATAGEALEALTVALEEQGWALHD